MYKQEQYKNLLKYFLSLLIWGCLIFVWSFIWQSYFSDNISRPFGYKGNLFIYSIYGILLYIFTKFYGGYQIGRYQKSDVILSSVLALIITNLITFLQTLLIDRAGSIEESRTALVNGDILLPIIRMTAIQVILIVLWSFIAHRIYMHVFPPYQMLLIYGGDSMADQIVRKILSRSDKYRIKESISIQGGLDAVYEKIHQYKAAVLCDLPPKMRNSILKHCFENSIRTYTTPKLSDILIRGAYNISLFDTPLLLSRNQGLTAEQIFIKRLMDIVISLLGLIVVSPILLIISIAIKIYDGGPVLFKQKRCTKNNKVFTLVKFRSMIINAETNGKSMPAVTNDPRITPIGKIIRATRTDELPQLWNILKGDMSLVGPRPERIEHVESYTKDIPEFVFRSRVKAGLTGSAQVLGRYNTSAYDKLKMDLTYIANYSLIHDFQLLFMTIKIIFIKSSTEGFETSDAFNKKPND